MAGSNAVCATVIFQNADRLSKGRVADVVCILHCCKVGIEESLPDCRGGTH